MRNLEPTQYGPLHKMDEMCFRDLCISLSLRPLGDVIGSNQHELPRLVAKGRGPAISFPHL